MRRNQWSFPTEQNESKGATQKVEYKIKFTDNFGVAGGSGITGVGS